MTINTKTCDGCKHEDKNGGEEPCYSCTRNDGAGPQDKMESKIDGELADAMERLDQARKLTGDTTNDFEPCTRIIDVDLGRISDSSAVVGFVVPVRLGADELGVYEDRIGCMHLCIMQNVNAPPESRVYRTWGPGSDLDRLGRAEGAPKPTFDQQRYRHLFTLASRTGRVICLFRDFSGPRPKKEETTP